MDERMNDKTNLDIHVAIVEIQGDVKHIREAMTSVSASVEKLTTCVAEHETKIQLVSARTNSQWWAIGVILASIIGTAITLIAK